MFKKLFFLLIGLLFLTSTAYAEDLTASLRNSSAVYKNGYYENFNLNLKDNFLDGYFISKIITKGNYLFVFSITPEINKLYNNNIAPLYDFEFVILEDAYAFFNVFDLRNSETVFSSGYIFKKAFAGDYLYPVQFSYSITISDNYVFINSPSYDQPEKTLSIIYDISKLPEVSMIGTIDIFPNAVSGNKAFVITEDGISGYDITDVNHPVLKGEYLTTAAIRHIEIEDKKAYIIKYVYANDSQNAFLEILDTANFSFNKIGKKYPIPFSFSARYYVKNNFVYIIDNTCDGGKGFTVLDASNPYNIKKISLGGFLGSYTAGGYDAITEDFLLSVRKGNVIILNIANPYNIFRSYPFSIHNSDYWQTSDITAAGKYLLVRYDSPGNSGYCKVCDFYPPAGNYISLYEITPFVDLASFDTKSKAKKRPKIVLRWQTGSEDGAKEFYIMRKNKNINKEIDSIDAKGTDSQGASYRIVDKTVKKGKRYKYQLFYKDTDGGEHLLKAANVSVQAE